MADFLDEYDDYERVETPRFPIRWRWALIVGAVVAGIVVLLTILVLDMQYDAWQENQAAQAEVLVDRLGDELKIPMLAGSTAELDIIAQGFLEKVPTVLAVKIQPGNGETRDYGGDVDLEQISDAASKDGQVYRLPNPYWFAKDVIYAGTNLGVVAVRFSAEAWNELLKGQLYRIALAALIAVVLSTLIVYWIAGRMSKPLEAMAEAAQQVAMGDYGVRLPVTGNDEISDAMQQFNAMIDEIAHKEEIRDIFGRYLNPKLVEDVFDKGQLPGGVEQRKEVTVLFADMVGFTEFSETTSTEEIVNVLNKHFEVFHGIVDYYGGHVDKYIGDAVMAVFNTPREDEEHAKHAAMAGIAMNMACIKLGVLRHTGEPISFRIGVNTGETIVGNIGAAERLEYTVIGDAVNLASRLTEVGKGQELVMTKQGYDLLGTGFNFVSLGNLEMKGKAALVECGNVSCVDSDMNDNIRHAVALAFDITLPSGVRHMLVDDFDNEF